VLQVLLSQVHRLRALILLSKSLDLGPRAVNLALDIGIFTCAYAFAVGGTRIEAYDGVNLGEDIGHQSFLPGGFVEK